MFKRPHEVEEFLERESRGIKTGAAVGPLAGLIPSSPDDPIFGCKTPDARLVENTEALLAESTNLRVALTRLAGCESPTGERYDAFMRLNAAIEHHPTVDMRNVMSELNGQLSDMNRTCDLGFDDVVGAVTEEARRTRQTIRQGFRDTRNGLNGISQGLKGVQQGMALGFSSVSDAVAALMQCTHTDLQIIARAIEAHGVRSAASRDRSTTRQVRAIRDHAAAVGKSIDGAGRDIMGAIQNHTSVLEHLEKNRSRVRSEEHGRVALNAWKGGDAELCVRASECALALWEGDAEIHHVLAASYLTLQRDYGKAERAAQAAVALFEFPGQKAWSLRLLGKIFQAQKRFMDGVKAFSQVLAVEDDMSVILELAHCLFMLGSMDRELDSLVRVIESPVGAPLSAREVAVRWLQFALGRAKYDPENAAASVNVALYHDPNLRHPIRIKEVFDEINPPPERVRELIDAVQEFRSQLMPFLVLLMQEV